MIRSARGLHKFAIVATDGPIGAIDDFLFDDERWAIRYVVVDTGRWLPGRQVLISPLSISRTDWHEQRIALSISRDAVKHSPGIDAHQPVSRRREQEYFDYYGYPYYWGQAGLWGAHALPMMPTRDEIAQRRLKAAEAERAAIEEGDAHLRSAATVAGYGIHATDGDLGHVEDVLFDDLSWAVRYLVVDTATWWFGKHVLVSPEWILDISWPERSVSVAVTRQSLKGAPTYDRAQHIDRQWELDYYRHLLQPGYWVTADEARELKEAQSYLSEDPESLRNTVERRSRPR